MDLEQFKKDLKKAMESGINEDWGYNEDIGEEYSFDKFESDIALNYVLLVLKEYKLIK